MASSSHPDAFRRTPTTHVETRPPPINVRYFYTSPLAIDDPLSPLPPPVIGTASASKRPPRPFSTFDNNALEKAWSDLRQKLLQQLAKAKSEQRQRSRAGTANSTTPTTSHSTARQGLSHDGTARSLRSESAANSPRLIPTRISANDAPQRRSGEASTSSSFRTSFLGDGSLPAVDTSSTTGNPFIRAPVRSELKSLDSRTSRNTSARPRPKPTSGPVDSYNWGEDTFGTKPLESRDVSKTREPASPMTTEKQITVTTPVGI